MLEVVGASNWAWHKGGLVGAKKSKAEPPGLSFCRQNTGGPLFWVNRNWVGPGKQSRGWVGWFFSWYAKWDLVLLTRILPNPLCFSQPSTPHTLFNHPFPPPKIILWIVYGWDVVVGGGGREKIGGSALQVVRSPLGLTVFLTPFRFICLAAPSGNCLNYSKYLNTY